MLKYNKQTAMAKREILFRGWNKKNKRWLYGYYLVNRGEHFISPDEFVNPLASYEDYVVEADTVGQYTGLKDAKGVKIFEGDIIESNDSRYVIQYDEEEAKVVAAHEKLSLLTRGFNQQWINKWKKVIIGNIHENSELIKTE